MAKIQIKNWLLIAISFLVLISFAQSLDLNVQISDTADYRVGDFGSDKNKNLISFDFSVENTGSLSCKYQAVTTINDSRGQKEVWSTSKPLMPGESTRLEVNNAIPNTTGDVKAQVAITFCEKEKVLETQQFNFNSSISEYNEIESLTMDASNREAGITLDIDNGLLVPVNSPGMWRLSSHRVENGEVKIRYRPEVYSEETHNYYVVQNGEVVGVTEIDLSERPKLGEKIRNFRYYFDF